MVDWEKEKEEIEKIEVCLFGLRRAEILKRAGLTEEDLKAIINTKPKDLKPEYREIFESLPKEMPNDLWEKIKAKLEKRNTY